MFDEFISKSTPYYKIKNVNDTKINSSLMTDEVKLFFKYFGGVSFYKGMYRVNTYSQILYWTEFIENTHLFSAYRGKILSFGSDWLGRHWCLYDGRMIENKPTILIFMPEGDILKVPLNFLVFHNKELVGYSDEILDGEFYSEWLTKGGSIPNNLQCVGYKNPLFLGGEDSADNLEIIDMEVYWEINIQLLEKINSIEQGSRIGNISIS